MYFAYGSNKLNSIKIINKRLCAKIKVDNSDGILNIKLQFNFSFLNLIKIIASFFHLTIVYFPFQPPPLYLKTERERETKIKFIQKY